MKLLVLGATGGTGLEIVRQALVRGHSLTVLVRSPNRLQPFQDRIAIKEGDLLSSNDLEPVVKGQDAILSAFGPRVPIVRADANLLQRFALALTRAMPSSGVKRIVVESVAFLFKNSIMPPAYLLGRLFFPRVVVQNLARRCGRLHDQGRRESAGCPRGHRTLQLIARNRMNPAIFQSNLVSRESLRKNEWHSSSLVFALPESAG